MKSIRIMSAALVCGLFAAPVLAQTATPGETAWTAVDFTELLTTLGTNMGTVIAACVGLAFAFLAIRKAVKWARGV